METKRISNTVLSTAQRQIIMEKYNSKHILYLLFDLISGVGGNSQGNTMLWEEGK